MSLALSLALAGLAHLWPFPPPQQTTNVVRQPTWYLSVRRDHFTGGLECRVFQGPRKHPTVAYARETLAFQFSRHLSTLQAAWRLDAGPVGAWSELYPSLVSSGVSLPDQSLDNPTGGQVILPLSDLRDGHAVTIRPTPRSQPRAFYLDGLADALANAKARGCGPNAFVR